MKLLTTKLLSVFVFIALLAVSTGVAQANTARVKGKIVDKDTGEGIMNVLVKWTDANGGVRYAKTNARGEYVFPKFHGETNRPVGAYESSERVDTDYNGSNDAPMWKVNELTGGEKADGFGCSQNPHTFAVLQRPDMIGTFENAGEDGVMISNMDHNNGEEEITLRTFYFIRSQPKCPTNIRHSCNISQGTATVTWNQPEGGADGYRLYYDRSPFNDIGAGDDLHDNVSNQLSRTFSISLNTDYIVRVRTVKDSQESESCLMQFRCDCPAGGCDGDGGGGDDDDGDDDDDDDNDDDPRLPTATLNSCPAKTDPYYAYTISNINTYGQPFHESRLMISFNLNSQTQRILNFLNNSSNSSVADYSQWNEEHRQKRTGDYFGFYIQTFNVLSGNSLAYQIGPNTRIGQKTMAELRNFLISEDITAQYVIKANMTTRVGQAGRLFNPHIPARRLIDLSKDFNSLCDKITDDPCPVINITQPAENEVLTPVNNKVTVEWTATGATALTQYEVMIYDKTDYPTPDQAYQAYLTGVSAPLAMPNNLIVYTASSTSQEVDFGDIDGLNPVNWMIAVRSKSTDANGQFCAWVTREPAPPGFPVSGRVYEYNPSCQPLVEVPIGGTISVTPSGQSIPVVSGQFNSSLPQSNLPYALQLTLADNAYSCANICGQGPSCVRDGITATNSNVTYFVKEEDIFTKSWWQVFGGYVFANNVMNSELPITDDNQSWRLMPALVPGIAETAGIPITNRNRFGNDAPDNTNVAGWLREPPLRVTSANVSDSIKPDFEYYVDKLGLPSTRLPDVVNQLSQLNGQNRSGVVVHYHEGSFTFAPNTSWNVSGNQHHVVLVSGNITISAENLSGTDTLVSTQLGSTVSFVSSGTITISGNVGNSNISSVNPNLSGIFVANQIVIQDDGNASEEDKRFVGEGSYIGWSGVSLQRQFDNLSLNETTPSETFIARPDFVINMPEVIRDATITWQEVN